MKIQLFSTIFSSFHITRHTPPSSLLPHTLLHHTPPSLTPHHTHATPITIHLLLHTFSCNKSPHHPREPQQKTPLITSADNTMYKSPSNWLHYSSFIRHTHPHLLPHSSLTPPYKKSFLPRP